jgi:putative transcriptional regulator
VVKTVKTPTWLNGQMLVAMPGMADPRFLHAVIFMCAHSETGAMGLIVNRLYGELDFRALLDQLNIEAHVYRPDIQIHAGGPVEPGRGFVLHTSDFVREGTVVVNDDFAVTATVEILKAMAEGQGPERAMLALGYAGWGAGQLESEIQANGWLSVPADDALIFGRDVDTKWEQALAKIGVNPTILSPTMGRA